MQLSDTGTTSEIYAQLLESTFAAYIKPPSTKSLPAAYTQPASIRHTPANHTKLSTKPLYLTVYHFLSVSHPSVAMITTSIGYGRELSNLAKIYID